MSARRPARKVPCPIDVGERSPPPDAFPGQESPLERNPLSPMGWKKRESDGVGLGILAKLSRDRSGCGSNRLAKLIIVAATAPIAIWPSRAVDAGRAGEWICKDKSSLAFAVSEGVFPVADFLSCCYLCRKMLHGKDIYMYRGEKAFCSMECRYQQIVSDESKEKYGANFMRRSDVTTSSCSGRGGSGGGCRGGRLFFTDQIMAA